RPRRRPRAARLAPGSARRERAPDGRRRPLRRAALRRRRRARARRGVLVHRSARARRNDLPRPARLGAARQGLHALRRPAGAALKKLVLAVIDGARPAIIEQAAADGHAPSLAALIERGRYIPDAVAAFPSVTPVCAATIATGLGPDRHGIPSMNWYHRAESRYIEYGSSFRAALRFGLGRQLTDLVYNMNGAHLAPDALTLFERL